MNMNKIKVLLNSSVGIDDKFQGFHQKVLKNNAKYLGKIIQKMGIYAQILGFVLRQLGQHGRINYMKIGIPLCVKRRTIINQS